MSKKKGKFDLTALVHKDQIKDGQELFFVSDPSRTCRVQRQPNGEFKVVDKTNKIKTVHAFVQEDCLGTEPPEHASRWLRTAEGKTLYELWHAEDGLPYAA